MNRHCVNCGWYPVGVAKDAYGPVRKTAATGMPEECVLTRKGTFYLKKVGV